MSNGNMERVSAIANEMLENYGPEGFKRSDVINAATNEGIPKGTASTIWQKWRKEKNLPKGTSK